MSRMKLVLVAVIASLLATIAHGQHTTVRPVSSTPLKMQSLHSRSTVQTGNFQSIQTLRDQPVYLKTAQQPDLESEVKALQSQDPIAPAAADNIQRSRAFDDSTLPGSIRDARVNILPSEKRTPNDRSAELMAASPEMWNDFSSTGLFVFWDAPNICYGRLYFEDPLLERYGQTTCNRHRDVIRSEAHFAVSTAMWPLRAALDIPGKCATPYGYCRPGTAMPEMRQHLLAR